MADVGCRNTVFGAEAQTDPSSLQAWQAAGITNFRLEFVHQTPEQIITIANAFGSYLAGDSNAKILQTLLSTVSPQGTSEGSLYVPEGFKNLVQLS